MNVPKNTENNECQSYMYGRFKCASNVKITYEITVIKKNHDEIIGNATSINNVIHNCKCSQNRPQLLKISNSPSVNIIYLGYNLTARVYIDWYIFGQYL